MPRVRILLYFEILKLALAGLTANKLRSSLTMLGIAVGVFSVIGVMTAISALRSSVESGLSVLGANSFQITRYPAINFTDPRQRFANRRPVSYAEAARVKQRLAAMDAADAAPASGHDGASALSAPVRVCLQLDRERQRAVYGERRTNPSLQLIGTDENYVPAANFEIARGRNLTGGDVEFGRSVCVIGDEIVQRLFPDESGIGRTIRAGGRNYTVVGTLAPKGTSFGQSQDNRLLVPVTRWLQDFGQRGRSVSLNIEAPSQAELPATQDRAIGVMRLVRQLEPEDADDFEVYTNDSLIETFNKIAGMITIGSFIISAIALVAAGIGVMNIMLVSVTERTREIGIRKSIGARKAGILVQFLIEAVTLSLLGGICGVLFGVVVGNIVAWMLKAGAVFPFAWAAVGLIVCGGIGVGFGLYPAWKAASLDPIEALRHE
ncbi:ABC-type antimicrobial peptide transport system, permease component [Opitutaceae bacterium TAV1]|nr:ABC-type antimicrobial peptide transport system, permease component [Opitutaceae bacterium TAV1]